MTMRPTLFGASVLALAAGAARAGPRPPVFDYAGFEDPAFHSKYVEKHGVSPTYAFFGDEEEAFQKLRSGFRSDVTTSAPAR
jgi:spermidine/putrescine transport system substrate-binding protein